jgi:hypothetical protein
MEPNFGAILCYYLFYYCRHHNIDLKTAVAVFQSLESFITDLRHLAQFEIFETAAKCTMPEVSQVYTRQKQAPEQGGDDKWLMSHQHLST